ncbi:CNNM domain-containing protein [Planctomycetota bacterium]
MVVLLLLYVGGALAISFLCSILEAALLSTRIPELMERQQQGDRGASVLLQLKEQRLDDAISAILTLNTIAHTIGATLAGAEAAVVFGSEWVGVFSAVLTLLVLVVTEIIPKTIGTTYASRLVGFVARSLQVIIGLLTPVLYLTRALTRLLASKHRPSISRGEIGALVALAAREGTLRGHESLVLKNMLRFEKVKVEDVMTPRTVAVTLPLATTLGELLENPEALLYSRIPLYEDNRDEIAGYVLLREPLRAAAGGAAREEGLATYRREAWFVPKSASLGDALREFLKRREHMAIVVDEFGGFSGLVTLEDLIETILGVEILDESDRVADLRVAALELRDQRLKRLQDAAGDST